MQSYRDFQHAKYFPQLDGLRAISVLLVLAIHMRDDLFRPLNGHLGVIIFFTISGFLITTLLLREERTYGRASFKGFYIRRSFRIFPLYYLALLVFSVLVLLGFADNAGDYGQRLVFFLTYLNEFASPGTFGHSWSLGIEEKYYLVWPLLAFAIPFMKRHRLALALLLLAGCSIAGIWGPPAYFGLYTPILTGVVVAIAMDDPKLFKVATVLARPAAAIPLFVAFMVAYVLESVPDHVHIVFSFLTALLFPALLIGPRISSAWLGIKPMVYVGQRAYGIYLFHPIVVSVVDRALAAGSSNPYTQSIRFVLTAFGSVLVADILFRYFEKPLIKVGHRLAQRPKPAAAKHSLEPQASRTGR